MHQNPVRAMARLLVLFLIIPLVIVVATRNPQAVGHLVEAVFILGARLLNAVATLLGLLLGGH